MYFPTSSARQLSAVPALPNLPAESVICLSPSPRKSLFCTLTRNGLAVWRVRVHYRLIPTHIYLSDFAISPLLYWRIFRVHLHLWSNTVKICQSAGRRMGRE
jgi:hypothetical protein